MSDVKDKFSGMSDEVKDKFRTETAVPKKRPTQIMIGSNRYFV